MALKFELDTLDGLDASIAGLYTESEGKFYLDVDGAVSKAKLNEFRETNVKLLKERDEILNNRVDKSELSKLQEQFEAEKTQLATELEALKAKQADLKTDPPTKDNTDELKALNKQIKQLEAIKKAQEDQLSSVQTDLSAKLSASEQEKRDLASKLSQFQLNAAVAEAVNVAGLDPLALPAIKILAAATFKTEGGELIAYDTDGSPMFSKDGNTALTVAEWAGNLKKSMPQFALQSFGAGLQNNTTAAGSSDTMTPLQRITSGLGANK